MKTFHLLLNETSRRLQGLTKRLGTCVDKSRPYYDAVGLAATARSECQKAAVQFQRSSGKTFETGFF
jgi:SH3-domain binding protein 5